MRQIETSTLANQDITAYLLAHTYTADADRAIYATIDLDQVAGNGDYSAYVTRQAAGAGSAYMVGPITTFTVPAAQTSIGFVTALIPVNDTDVLKFYVKGLGGDTTTVDVTTRIFEPASLYAAGTNGAGTIYATLAELRAYMTVRGGLDNTTDADDDAAATDILEMTSRFIDGQCARRFYYNAADETRYYTPEDPNWLFVDDLSAAPTSVALDTLGNRTYSTALSSSDFDLLPINAALDGMPYCRLEMHWDSPNNFPTSYRNSVRVVGKFGFPSVPDDIHSACLAIALNVYQSRTGQSNAGNVSITAAGVVVRPQDVPGWAQQVFAKYRRYV